MEQAGEEGEWLFRGAEKPPPAPSMRIQVNAGFLALCYPIQHNPAAEWHEPNVSACEVEGVTQVPLGQPTPIPAGFTRHLSP